MHIYGEITKVEPLDDGTIKVSGVASSGAVDDAEETVLPAAMKAALPAYMRFGALREMHGLTAAGATLHAEVGEDGQTRIETHVVDPLAVKKVRLGVYKGFSIGGKVLERDPGDRRVITRIKLDEISLVDRPCNPEAVIDMWKADREESQPTNAEVIAQARALAVAAGKPGRHADFVVKAREALLRAGPAQPAPNADDPDAPELGAGPAEADNVNDGLDPAAIADRLDALLEPLDPDAAADVLAELAARRGLVLAAADDDENDQDVGKYAGVFDVWPAAAPDDAADRIEGLRRTVRALEARVEKLAAQPLAPKAVAGLTRAVGKAEDASPGGASAQITADEFRKYLDGLPQDQRGQLQLRAALRAPIPIGPR